MPDTLPPPGGRRRRRAAALALAVLCLPSAAWGASERLLGPGEPEGRGQALADAPPPSQAIDPRALGPGGAMRFGVGARSVELARSMGTPPDMAQLWTGPWTDAAGWREVEQRAAELAAQGVVPVVEWWYWGDAISEACLEQGCLHRGTWRDRAGWRAGTTQLAHALARGLEGRPGVVVLETEFNKQHVRRSEALDLALALEANYLRERVPGLTIAVGFGLWGALDSDAFDLAAAASDVLGLQGLRGSTRHDDAAYLGLADELLRGARHLHATFGKPVLVHDLALSSYPAATHEPLQREALARVLAALPALEEAGVVGLVYRNLFDSDLGDMGDYYGQAEGKWGFLRSVEPAIPKPAAEAWYLGVTEERVAAAWR